MPPEIAAAMIGALTILMVAFKEEIRNLFSRGQRDWSGTWTGTGHSDPTSEDYQITVKLTQRGRVVTGTLTAQGPEVVEYDIKGRIREQEFMTYCAQNVDKNTVNYLVGINQLSREGDRITGVYVARSRFVDRVATGTIDLVSARGRRRKPTKERSLDRDG